METMQQQGMSGYPDANAGYDARPFRVVYEFTDDLGRTHCIHQGQARPAQWHFYHSDRTALAREVLRLKKGGA